MATYEGLPQVFAASVAEAMGDNPLDPTRYGFKFLPEGVERAIERGYGQLDKNVFGGFLPGGAESVRGKLERLEKGELIPAPAQTLPVDPYTGSSKIEPQRTTRLPGDQPQPTTNGLGGLVDVLREEIRQRGQRQDRITSPEYIDDAMRRRQQELAYATDLLSKAQMGQMREKTRRDVIDGWRKIQQEKIRANTVMATAMMNTAYLAATPNANVLSALNVASDSAMRAFQPGQAVN